MMLGAYINLFFYKIDKVTNKYCFGAGVVRNDPSSEGIVAVCDLRNIFAHFTDINRAINTLSYIENSLVILMVIIMIQL